jgi:hypothetical protein
VLPVANRIGVPVRTPAAARVDVQKQLSAVSPPLKRMSIDVPADLQWFAKEMASKRRMKLREYIIELLEREREREQKKPVRQ